MTTTDYRLVRTSTYNPDHFLSRRARHIYQLTDGRRTMGEIARLLNISVDLVLTIVVQLCKLGYITVTLSGGAVLSY